jgi:uncharacterized membrane protein
MTPTILLINENKIVSRLLGLSCEKNGYKLEEVKTLDVSTDSYDVVFVDSELYSNELLTEIEEKLKYTKLGYIGTKQNDSPDGFDLVIEKPFLPTDFVDMIKNKVIGSASQNDTDLSAEEDDMDLLMDDEDLNLDTLDDDVDELLKGDEEQLEDLEDLDTLDDNLDVDLSLDSATVMTTGIADQMALPDANNEDLADMVFEIDDMPEDDILSEIDMDEKIEPQEEITKEIAEEKKDEIIEQEKKDDSLGLDALVAGVGAAAVVSEIGEDKQKGVLAMDDIDNLKESDIQEALGESVSEISEEIVSEELNQAEETVVESNDVEQWIRDAVSKAITPSMIKEALDGMDINVTLSFSSKKEDKDTA